jgi:hypothetical protein
MAGRRSDQESLHFGVKTSFDGIDMAAVSILQGRHRREEYRGLQA